MTKKITIPSQAAHWSHPANINAVYGKPGAPSDPPLDATDLRIGMMYEPNRHKEITEAGRRIVRERLAEYLNHDLEATEELRKRAEVDEIITEALRMQLRGKPAPLPRPTYLAVHVRLALDNWSI